MVLINSTNTSVSSCLLTSDFGESLHIPSLPKSVVPTQITLAAVNGVAAPPTIIINLLIIWTVLEDKNLRSKSYYIVLAALAFTDILVGLVVKPTYVWRAVCLLQGCRIPCFYTIAALPIIICGCLTLCTLMMASMERYFAIVHCLFHRTQVTTKRTTISIMVIWLSMPATLALGRVIADDSSMRKVPILVMASLNVVIILYCSISVRIKVYQRQKRSNGISCGRVHQRQQEQQQQQENEHQQRAQRRLRKDYKGAFTVFIIVAATVVFYTPIIICQIIETLKGRDVTEDFKWISQPISITFLNLQSLVNPLILAFRMPMILKGVKTKLSKLACFPKEPGSSTVIDPSTLGASNSSKK